MTVAELIAELQKRDPGDQVLTWYPGDDYRTEGWVSLEGMAQPGIDGLPAGSVGLI